MKCGICGADARKTSMAVVVYEGNVDRKRACNRCVKRGVLVTTMPSTVVGITTTLDAEEKDIREVLRKLARHLRGLAKGYEGINNHLANGLEQSGDIAEAWAARPEARR